MVLSARDWSSHCLLLCTWYLPVLSSPFSWWSHCCPHSSCPAPRAGPQGRIANSPSCAQLWCPSSLLWLLSFLAQEQPNQQAQELGQAGEQVCPHCLLPLSQALAVLITIPAHLPQHGKLLNGCMPPQGFSHLALNN